MIVLLLVNQRKTPGYYRYISEQQLQLLEERANSEYDSAIAQKKYLRVSHMWLVDWYTYALVISQMSCILYQSYNHAFQCHDVYRFETDI